MALTNRRRSHNAAPMSSAGDEIEALRAEVRRLRSVVRRLEEDKQNLEERFAFLAPGVRERGGAIKAGLFRRQAACSAGRWSG